MFYVNEPKNPLFGVSRAGGRVKVIGIPMEDTLSFRPGTRFAPQTLRYITPYLEATPTDYLNVDPLSELVDVGDVLLLQGDVNANLARIEETVMELLKENGLVLSIGGEHTLSLATARAVKKLYGNLGAFIQLDAHLDMREEWPMGQRLSHATFARVLVDEVKPMVIANIGFRGFDESELKHALDIGAILVDSTELKSLKPSQIHELLGRLRDVNAPVHISIDIDVFDPSVAPGVGNPEAGGVNYMDVYKVLEVIIPMVSDKLVLIDIVEYSPPNDVGVVTGALVSKLIIDTVNLYLWSITCR